MSVYPSLKRFTHRLTLLAPIHVCSFANWSPACVSDVEVSFGQEILCLKYAENSCLIRISRIAVAWLLFVIPLCEWLSVRDIYATLTPHCLIMRRRNRVMNSVKWRIWTEVILISTQRCIVFRNWRKQNKKRTTFQDIQFVDRDSNSAHLWYKFNSLMLRHSLVTSLNYDASLITLKILREVNN
jgi:hypothetical protein